MRKLLFIVGARPEVIKMSPLIQAFGRVPDAFAIKVCFTGQHRELAQQALDFFEIRPDYNLQVMQAQQSLAQLTASLMTALEPVFRQEQPDLAFVQGDTTTAFCGALAAYYAGVPVCHVEAGLRTGQIRSPFPEEFNRMAISRIAAFHAAPTKTSRRNLLCEGVPDAAIAVTGNTAIDALLWAKARMETAESEALTSFGQSLRLENQRLVLITLHRREHQGAKMEGMQRALAALAARYPQAVFVLPLHPNPIVQAALRPLTSLPNVQLIAPASYETFVWLLSKAFLILTDSGGIQEEAPSLGKPVVVLRDHTERPEAIEAGTAVLAGTSPETIVETVARLMEDATVYEKMVARCVANPFGDGQASGRILEWITRQFSGADV